MSGVSASAGTAANDSYNGASANNVLTLTSGVPGGLDKFTGGTSHDTLVLSGGNPGIGAIGVERIIGSAASDVLQIQTLTGQKTYFAGGGGADLLNLHAPLGGDSNNGAIRVIFTSTANLGSGMILSGFDFASDKLLFSEASFKDALGNLNSVASGAVGGIGLSTGAGGVIVGTDQTQFSSVNTWLYNTNSHVLSYDADGNGSGVGVQVAQFANAFNETQTNIASALKFLDAGDLTAYLNPATVKPAALPV